MQVGKPPAVLVMCGIPGTALGKLRFKQRVMVPEDPPREDAGSWLLPCIPARPPQLHIQAGPGASYVPGSALRTRL